jgi:tRNA splicing endonuclease
MPSLGRGVRSCRSTGGTQQAPQHKSQTRCTMADVDGPIRVYWDGQRFLVWNTRHVYTLRCLHRIVGCTVGALPHNKRQTQEYGMPVSLLLEEALLIAEEGIADVLDASTLDVVPKPRTDATTDATGVAASSASGPPTTSTWIHIDGACAAWAEAPLPKLLPAQIRLAGANRLLHAAVFRSLWSKGFWITTSSSFGADYLCYPGDPMRHHAHVLIHVSRPGRPIRALEQGCTARLANSVKKTGVLAEVIDGGEVRFSPFSQPKIELKPPTPMSNTGAKRSLTSASGDAGAAVGSGTGAGKDHVVAEQGTEPGTLHRAPVPSAALAEAQALIAPVEGGPQVPAPREPTRRARAPWEAPGRPGQ